MHGLFLSTSTCPKVHPSWYEPFSTPCTLLHLHTEPHIFFLESPWKHREPTLLFLPLFSWHLEISLVFTKIANTNSNCCNSNQWQMFFSNKKNKCRNTVFSWHKDKLPGKHVLCKMFGDISAEQKCKNELYRTTTADGQSSNHMGNKNLESFVVLYYSQSWLDFHL